MKKLLVFIGLMFFGIACADTINLHWLNDDGTIYQNSSCTVDGDLIVPTTPPTKYGYTFAGWEISPYIPIEYLESTGTQYIDTGIQTNGYDRFVSSWHSIKDTDNLVLYGGSNGTIRTGERAVFWYTNRIDFVTPYASTTSSYESIQDVWYSGQDYIIDDNLTYFLINNVERSRDVSVSFLSRYNFYIFGMSRNGNDVLWRPSVRLKRFRWYRNNVLFRDFIPVLDLNGTPCMFDKVEKKFYYNAGTGDFIAGPVLNE